VHWAAELTFATMIRRWNHSDVDAFLSQDPDAARVRDELRPPELFKPYFVWLCTQFDRILRLPRIEGAIRIAPLVSTSSTTTRRIHLVWSDSPLATTLAALPRRLRTHWMKLPEAAAPPTPSPMRTARATGHARAVRVFNQGAGTEVFDALRAPMAMDMDGRTVDVIAEIRGMDWHRHTNGATSLAHVDVRFTPPSWIEPETLALVRAAPREVDRILREEGLGLQTTPDIFTPPDERVISPDMAEILGRLLVEQQRIRTLGATATPFPPNRLPTAHWILSPDSWLQVLAQHMSATQADDPVSPEEIFFRIAVLSLASQQDRHRDWASSDEGRAALQSGAVADPFDVVHRTIEWHNRAARMAKRMAAGIAGPTVPALELDTPHGRIEVLPLATADALVQESALMDHCVGTASIYRDRLKKGLATYWSIRAPLATAPALRTVSRAGFKVPGQADESGCTVELPIDKEGRIGVATLEVMGGRVLQCKMMADIQPSQVDPVGTSPALQVARAAVEALRTIGVVKSRELPVDLHRPTSLGAHRPH